MLKIWKKISETILFKNQWWEYRKDLFEIPGIKQGEYHYVYSRGSSMIIPVTDDNKFILVKQFRYLNNRFSIEFPCGGVNDGDSHLQTALKELEEETGFTSNDLKVIGEFNPYNGVTNETCKVFVANHLLPRKAAHDDTEEFELMFLDEKEINTFLDENQIWDGMTLAALKIYEIFIRRT